MGAGLFFLFATHLYFTFYLRGVQRQILQGLRFSFARHATKGEGLSPFSALATALAATVGTGNLIGISAAVAVGGAGAVFWCWLTGLLGMATCYGECFLSVKYAKRGGEGITGGPMYVMEFAWGRKDVAVFFSVMAILASFCVGSGVQSRAICSALEEWCGDRIYWLGPLLVCVAGMILLGGIQSIAGVCRWLVPFMILLYLGGCLCLLWQNRRVLPQALGLIVAGAFSPRAAAVGVSTGTVLKAVREGLVKGLFTNEAGLGSIPMTAVAAGKQSPARQAMIAMTGPFWDTMVVCAVTGLVIVSSMLQDPFLFHNAAKERLCFLAFSKLPGGNVLLSVSLILFAFATIIGWHFYGECGVRYLFGEGGVGQYRILYLLAVYAGTILSMELVLSVTDFVNLCMAMPNLLCLWKLRREIR